VNDLFLRACRGDAVERAPIWIMRQAGRYMAEYRAIREKVDFVTLCKTPELAAEVTLQPIDKLGVDAAILFSDILVPAEPMGFRLDFRPGPVLDPPVRSAADVGRIRVPAAEEMSYVYMAIRILRRELERRVPLIGFGAAPFTLAAYLVEGEGSKSFDNMKGLIFGEPATAHALLEKVTATLEGYLEAQVAAGAQAIQVFDSWAGVLSERDYADFALPYAKRLITTVKKAQVPVIYFALNSAHLLDSVRECGANVAGIDWRTSLAKASRRLDHKFVVQGNLDPCVLLGPREEIARRALRVLEEGAKAPGHIFNLGHGILPHTPVDNALHLVETVKGAVSAKRT
jgi:uroporphyrinogen decarboxylase